MSDYNDFVTFDARLVILRALTEQPDGRLNESLLADVLDVYGHKRSRDWIRQQLRYLADIGAVKNTDVSGIIVAAITRLGVDHVERRTELEGVKRPKIGA
jgi:DNA-binding GntR family transcriptional regulator